VSEPIPPDGHLMRGLAPDNGYRFVATICTEPAREAAARHGVKGVHAAALGRGIGATLCLATLTKGGERVTVQWNGDGPLGGLVADARDNGDVRAYLSGEVGPARVLAPEIRPRLKRLIGRNGLLTVIRDLGLKEDYIGQGELVDGEMDTDVEGYLLRSEQVDSALGCEVVLDDDGEIVICAALLIQGMPGGTCDAVAEVRAALRAGALRELLNEGPPGLDAGMLVAAIVPEGMARVLATTAVRFHCSCDAERMEGALRTLGPAELVEMAETEKSAEISCHFCNDHYRVGAERLIELADELRRSLN
jgi:molecular chaperone Hsp33